MNLYQQAMNQQSPASFGVTSASEIRRIEDLIGRAKGIYAAIDDAAGAAQAIADRLLGMQPESSEAQGGVGTDACQIYQLEHVLSEIANRTNETLRQIDRLSKL